MLRKNNTLCTRVYLVDYKQETKVYGCEWKIKQKTLLTKRFETIIISLLRRMGLAGEVGKGWLSQDLFLKNIKNKLKKT